MELCLEDDDEDDEEYREEGAFTVMLDEPSSDRPMVSPTFDRGVCV